MPPKILRTGLNLQIIEPGQVGLDQLDSFCEDTSPESSGECGVYFSFVSGLGCSDL